MSRGLPASRLRESSSSKPSSTPPKGEIPGFGVFAFGNEPNPDANDGTSVGTVLDVTPGSSPA